MQQQRAEVANLPVPDADAMAHSRRLIDHIRQRIETGSEGGQPGQITFAEYMDLALMAPGLGYYSAGSRKFGQQGDFVTAPEISPMFSHCVARQCAQMIEFTREQGAVEILECGAGTGVMAAEILIELERLNSLPDHYYILELSADLQQRQQETLTQHVPQLMDRIVWLDKLPKQGIRGIILANELLDAMPVHRLLIDGEIMQEYYVACEGNGFVCRPGPMSDQLQQRKFRNRIESILPLEGPYKTEINVAMDGWLHSMAEILKEGMMLLLDYGFPRPEYYHPQRKQGTLMCHYRHRSHDDPFVYPGLQDITAHVDFTAVAEAAVEAGLDVAGYCSQAHFLLSCGLTDSLAAVDQSDTVAYMSATQQVKTLTSPDEMGELFKVIALTKNIDIPLLGFSFRDQREKL